MQSDLLEPVKREDPISGAVAGSSIPAARAADRPHLAYLDGIRGLAALSIVFCHAYGTWQGPWNAGHVPHSALTFFQIASYGHVGVAVFIVLSGYCLTLPVVRSEGKTFANGIAGFLKRRAWRILPPYYAALAFSLLVIGLVPGMRTPHGCYSDAALPAFGFGAIASHLLLVHNLNAAWNSKIDYPLWSVALEWQLYFVFAFVLLPVWRRFGAPVLLAVAAVLGIGVLPRLGHLSDANFHFMALFVFGMLATVPTVKAPGLRLRALLPGSALALWALILGLCALHPGALEHHIVPADLFVGVSTALLLVALTGLGGREMPADRISRRLRRFLEARPLVALGAFSYSLYLVHAPVLEVVHRVLCRSHPGWIQAGAILFGVGTVCSVAVSYLFHLAFERPFLKRRALPRFVLRGGA